MLKVQQILLQPFILFPTVKVHLFICFKISMTSLWDSIYIIWCICNTWDTPLPGSQAVWQDVTHCRPCGLHWRSGTSCICFTHTQGTVYTCTFLHSQHILSVIWRFRTHVVRTCFTRALMLNSFTFTFSLYSAMQTYHMKSPNLK